MRKVLKYRWVILAGWIIATVLFTVYQPDLKQMLNQKGEVTITENSPSKLASKLLEGMAVAKGDSLILIFNDEKKLSSQDLKEIQTGIRALDKNRAKLNITNITDPFSMPDAKDQLISKDQTTLLVQVNYEKGNRDYQTVIDDFNEAVKDVGVAHYITGDMAVMNDYLKSVGKGVDKSAVITVAFILIVLILMFRSVVTPFVSLISVGVSYVCAMGIIGVLINSFDFPITSLTQMFVIIVLFGIGTDYHILLLNRYKEELGNGLEVNEAIVKSYKTAGKTILFSGLTVFMGFASLTFVQFPIYRSANAVAIGIAVLLLEMMTLTPILMKLLAKKLFWPARHSSGHKDSRVWEKAASASVKHPVISLFVIALILSPIILFGSHSLSFDSLKDLSQDNPSVQGFNLVKEKFDAGKAMPTTIVINSTHALDNNEALAVIDGLTERIKKIHGVNQVLGPTQPKGEPIKDFYTSKQTKTVVSGLDRANEGVGKIKNGLDRMENSLQSPDFSQLKKLSEGSGKLITGMTAISDGLVKIDTGIGKGADGADQLAVGIAKLKDGVQQLNAGLQTVSGNLMTINNGYTELGKGYQTLPSYMEQLKLLLTMIQGATMKIDTKLPNDSDVAALKVMIEKLSSAMDQISSGITVANGNYDKLNAGLSQLNTAMKTMIDSTGARSQLMVGIMKLEQGARSLSIGLRQGSVGQKQVIASMAKLKQGQEQVRLGQETLIRGVSKLGNGMNQLKDGLSKSGDGLVAVSDGIRKSNDFLTQLAGTSSFYIPTEVFGTKDMTKVFDAYLSKDRRIAKLSVIFDYEPYSDKAIGLIDDIDQIIGSQLKGTSLSAARYGIAGVTSHSNDLRSMATHDITFTQIVVLLAIFILLVIIIKSFWIPLYVIGALVVAYYTSLSAVGFIAKQLFDSAQNGLSWNVPFFTFIAIASLGVDYSIFLLRRFKEYPGLPVKEAIVLAAKNIGGVVISAAIILAGTFATLYPSNLIVLMELAIGVVIGLLLLSFVLLPIVIPALISIGERIGVTAQMKHKVEKEISIKVE